MQQQVSLTRSKHFRGAQGQAANPEKVLTLPLDFFGASITRTANPASPNITITYAKLANFLNAAERLTSMRAIDTSPGEISMERMKKRKRVPTPPEELSSDAERRYAEGEALAEEKQDAADEDYRGGSNASAAVDVPHRALRESKRLRGQADGR